MSDINYIGELPEGKFPINFKIIGQYQYKEIPMWPTG